MSTLSASALLDIWERGQAHGPLTRAALLLAASHPALPPAQFGQMPLGRRDALLLALRQALFGARIASVATCPACGDQLELAFDHADLPQDANAGEAIHALELDGHALRFRCPNSDDLAALQQTATMLTAAAHGPGVERTTSARLALLERCVLEAQRAALPVAVADLPTHVLDAIEEGMAQADPGADLRLAVACPACGHRWQALFDIVAFFWSEIDSWAGRLLRDVHALAAAYGWSEREILELSPFRRRCYLDMVGA